MSAYSKFVLFMRLELQAHISTTIPGRCLALMKGDFVLRSEIRKVSSSSGYTFKNIDINARLFIERSCLLDSDEGMLLAVSRT